MTYYRFPEWKFGKVLLGLFLLALLLLSRESMYSLYILYFTTCQILTIAILFVVGVSFLAVNRKRWKEIFTDKRLPALALLTLVMLLPMVVKQDWRMMYFSVLLCLFAAVLISYFADLEEVAKAYVVVMAFLGAFSLLTHYGLRYLADAGILQVPMFSNFFGFDFYFFGLSAESLVFVKNRNFGIFREPGVYQYFLVLALFLNNYRICWKKNWQLWLFNGILAVTVLSTFATGGVIEMGLLAVVLFFDKKWYKSKLGITLCAGAVLCVGAAAAFILIQKGPLYEDLYYMFYKLVSPEESSVSRMGSVVLNLQLFAKNPLVGQHMSAVLEGMQDNTTSTLILYAIYGIVGGTLHVAGCFALVWDKHRKIWFNLLLVLILLMSFNTQNLIWNIFFWLFPVLAMLERGLPFAERLRLGKKE